ncbi:DUF5658 family protein [Fictibacillus sp. WQ 8-8]|uniref:DUF5658 family protein n=1 Tax=unclassified Fictibacillus TaxID=2644029 RepID=UPI0006A7DB27|nr:MULTISPECIES: DUF5658 family protein [unclassified Fictibacillus]MCQ6265296.1 DUF5658 family protein [Fictibacillus sp. WQ 8-8]MED2971966.1 DUF5658 family protein [Fictibacillus sp. B-59209]UZJ77614.1 DUF5658 family protein [Fictibacillus sp. KU28468]
MRLYKWICYLLALFNLADAFLTYRLLKHGGEELNPVMRLLFDFHPFAFIAVKILFSFLVLLLSFLPLRSKIKFFVYIAFFVYLLIMGWHIYILLILSMQ